MRRRLRALGKHHQASLSQIRRLLAHGHLAGHPGAKRHTSAFLVGENETLAHAVERIVSQSGKVVDRHAAASFRNFMGATGNAASDLPFERIAEAVTVLRREGVGGLISPSDVFELIGGTETGIRRIMKTMDSVLPTQPGPVGDDALSHSAALRELECNYHILNAAIEMGLVSEMRCGQTRQLDLEAGSAFATIEVRFEEMANHPCSLKRIGQYIQVRRLLGRLAHEPTPPAFLDDVIDWFIDQGFEPGMTEVYRLIGGCKKQTRKRFKERYRAGDPVIFPTRRAPTGTHTLSQMCEGLPEPIRRLPHTALDPYESSPANLPSAQYINLVAECSHPLMKTIAAVVVLACFADPSNKGIRSRVLACIGRLINYFEGSDPTNPADVSRVLEAITLTASISREAEQSQLLYTILSWPHLVSVYEKYMAHTDIAGATGSFLLANAPALPGGFNCVIRQAGRAHQQRTDKRKEMSDYELDDLLTNFNEHYLICEGRRNFTRAFRAHVTRKVEQLETWGVPSAGPFPAISCIFSRVEETGPEGRRKTIIRYRLWAWEALIAKVAEKIGKNVWRVQKGRAAKWEIELFENKYVVEFESCLHEDGTQATAPNFVEFQTAQIFDPLLALDTDQDVQAQAKLLIEMGVLPTSMARRSTGLGYFAEKHVSLARHARREFGMILVPLDEHDHWEALAHYSISAKIDQPTRQGEFLSFDIDDGFSQHVGDDGSVSSVFYSYRKKKLHKHGFVLSTETDRLAEEFLLKTERRRYGNQPLGKANKPEGAHPLSPDVARFVMAYGNGNSISGAHVDASVRAFGRGLFSVSSHKFKYVWNRLAAESGLSIRQRMERQGHAEPRTTLIYNPRTSADRREDIEETKCHSSLRRHAMLTSYLQARQEPSILGDLTLRSAKLRTEIQAETDSLLRANLVEEYGRLQISINAEAKAGRLPRQFGPQFSSRGGNG